MGLGASTEQPAETSEGFHLHGVSRPRGAGVRTDAPGRLIAGQRAAEAGSRP